MKRPSPSAPAESAAQRRGSVRRDLLSRVPREGRQKTIRSSKTRKHKTASGKEGSATRLTNVRRHLFAKTGMLPLDFLTAVYRDELFDAYERVTMEGGRAFYFVPTKDAKKITVSLDQRISAAQHAAPYVHRKMPQGFEVTDRTQKMVTAEQLAKLPQKDLMLLTSVLDRLDDQGAPPSLKGAAIAGSKTYEQDGTEIKPHEEALA